MLMHDDLSRRLAQADRDHQGQLGLAFLWRAAKYVGAALVALFVLDVIWQFRGPARAVFSAAFLAGAAGVAAWTFHVARQRRNRAENTARLLETRDVSLGSKLINYLQLRRDLDAQPALTRQLSEMALADYSARLANVDFKPLTRAPELPRHRTRAAWALGAFALMLVACYPISKLELLRYADPFGDHPPFSLTRLEITEPAADGARVTYNEGIIVKVSTAGHTPDELYLSFYDPARPDAVHTVPMYGKGDLGFLQQVDGVKTDLVVYAHTKNNYSVSRRRSISVTLTPKVDKAFVTVTPPAYTGLKAVETPFAFKEVKALVNSEVKFRVQSNRPLAGGSIAQQSENAPAVPVPLRPSAEREVSGAFAAAESGQLKFTLEDVAHNVSPPGLSASLIVTHDLPPEINIDNPVSDSFVCEDFTVEARISATDDYGLKTIRVHRALNGVFSPPREVSYDTITTSATERETFDIKDLGVQPGDTISFFAEAVDTCPEPHLAQSKTIHLMVISTDDYNNDLRERSEISDIEGKYSELLNDFHDLVDEQKAISDKIKDVQDKLAKGGDPQKLPAELDKLLARQAELNKKLADMADRMEKFVRAKPLYDLETDLQQTLTQKAGEMRESLEDNNAALKELAAKMATGNLTQEQRLQALAALQEHSDKQLASIDQSQREAEEKIIPPLQDAELMNEIVNDMNHLKALYEAQQATAEQTKAMEHNPRLSETDRLALKQCAGVEQQMGQELQRVVADLREHAKAAREKFPQSAESARDLALAMEHGDLSGLAANAARTMLAGGGAASYQSAEKLRQEMAKLFTDSEPKAGTCMSPEMDHYLRLRHNLTAGQTFKQMSQGRKHGFGVRGMGSGLQGQGGSDGYAASAGESFGMLGGETFAGRPEHSGSGGHSQAPAAGAGQQATLDPAGTIDGAQAVNRATGNVQTESPIEGYRDVIDAYFNTITK